ncbi:MAG: hypothetical protein EOP11_19075 [Proteobacteria bacterium]|nr:MAG: hypothetical protein EOP11_19075 [Pseudomonadota bacterium]
MKRAGCLRALPLFFLFFFAFSGCDQLANLGIKAPATKKPAAVRETSAEPTGKLLTAGDRFNFYRWLVKEMQEQILGRATTDNAKINNWAGVLAQAGSLEGVYHGIVLSTDYNDLEKGRADLKAVRFFASEMAALDFPLLPETDAKVVAATQGYAQTAMTTPLFTLKRLLGERILEESVKQKGDAERLANWYAPLAAKWSRVGIPLGAEQRARTDEAFHFRWATENNLGLVQWELLNRAHRILNALGGVPAIAASAPAAATPAGK